MVGHSKSQYLKMAYNLAVSLKVNGTAAEIGLVTDLNVGGLLDDQGKKMPNVFDRVIEIPSDLKKLLNRYPFYIKTRIFDLCPKDWQECVYLDVDALFLQNPDFLFDLWGDFGMIVNWKRPANTTEKRKTWAKPGPLFDYYGFDKSGWFYDTNSSIIKFGQNDLSREVFELSEYYYAENFYPEYYHEGFGYYPDELAFNTALAKLQPDLEECHPMRFMHSDSKRAAQEVNEILADKCFGLYGNDSVTHDMLYRAYNRLVMDQGRQYHKTYGFRIDPSQKAANGHEKRPRYRGIREMRTIIEKKV